MFKTSKSEELYERFYKFARDCAFAAGKLPRSAANQIYARQLIRSSSSVPANYLEAQESLSRKDFIYRLMVCRKEAKESIQWLRLILDVNGQSDEFDRLLKEAGEFVKIFSKAVETTKSHSYLSR